MADISANTDLTLKAATPLTEQDIPIQKEDARVESTTALSVSRLPDIRLNENIIKDSVFTYTNSPELSTALNTFKAGDTQTAAHLYEQAATDDKLPTQISAEAAAQAALIYLESGKYSAALASIKTATDLQDQNPFYQLIKVWIYAASHNAKKAQKEFDNLLFLTADFEYLSSAKMALTMADFYEKKYDSAINRLQNLYGSDPYVISHAVYMMGRVNFNKKDYGLAQTLFEQALRHDNTNYQAQKYLALTQYKLKQFVPAWQSFASLFVLDTTNKDIKRKLDKLSKYLKGDPKNYLFYTRLTELYTTTPTTIDSAPLRIALFTKANGEPSKVKSFSFLPGSSFTIKDENLGKVINIPAFTPRTIVFNKEHSAATIQNKWNNTEFATKQPFVIELDQKGATLLVKDVETDDIFAADTGDKELKGNILVIPHEDGLTIINYTTVEDALPSLLMSAARGIKDPALLQAQAIVLRTQLLRSLENTKNNSFDIADNNQSLKYGGVNMQAQYTVDASAATEGQILAQEGKTEPAGVNFYRSCSAVTEEGVKNTNNIFTYNFSPANLFKFMISNPQEDLLSAPQDPTLWSSVKWVYTSPVNEVQQRLDKNYKTGKIKSVTPAEFTPQGRVLKVRFTGSKNSVVLPFDEANKILASGTLRSNFFVIIPFGKEGKIKEFMFTGSDTGLGSGLCTNGAEGLAREGKTAQEILNYYYPSLQIIK